MSEFSIRLSTKIDHKEIWKDCLRIIKDNVPFIAYNTWFLPIVPVELNKTILKVQVPNNFFIEWIDGHYNKIVNNAIKEIIGEDARLAYIVVESQEIEEEDQGIKTAIEKKPTRQANIPAEPEINSNLNHRYIFESFVQGESNQLARAASIAVSENPGSTSFNPLFIYGGVGLGKTHLIQAIGNKICSSNSGKRVIYLSADSFTVEFVEAIQANNVNEFSNFYKGMDVLIIDDIQFLIGKEKTQDLFFHIFNNLHQSGKQIILSSDKPPKELAGLNERLISRFQWGLTADIQTPDLETRIAILKNKSTSFGIKLNNEIHEYIAYNISSNIRELEGCLIKLMANSSFSSKEIDFNLVKKTVREVSTRRSTNISIDSITREVCEYFGVEENKVREKNRKKEVVMARQVAMYLSKQLTRASLKTIGLHFGGRDHSTVIHAFNNIENMVSEDLKMKDSVDSLKNKLEMSAA